MECIVCMFHANDGFRYSSVTQHHRQPSTQISRIIVLVYCSGFWVILVSFVAGFVGGCRWFWVVLGGFGSFWLVPCFSNYTNFKLNVLNLFIIIFYSACNSLCVANKINIKC